MAILSNIILTLKNGRNIDLSVGDSDSESSWQIGDSDRHNFVIIPWINLGAWGFTLAGALSHI